MLTMLHSSLASLCTPYFNIQNWILLTECIYLFRNVPTRSSTFTLSVGFIHAYSAAGLKSVCRRNFLWPANLTEIFALFLVRWANSQLTLNFKMRLHIQPLLSFLKLINKDNNYLYYLLLPQHCPLLKAFTFIDYLYQKDQWSLPGNLQNDKATIISPLTPVVSLNTPFSSSLPVSGIRGV